MLYMQTLAQSACIQRITHEGLLQLVLTDVDTHFGNISGPLIDKALWNLLLRSKGRIYPSIHVCCLLKVTQPGDELWGRGFLSSPVS